MSVDFQEVMNDRQHFCTSNGTGLGLAIAENFIALLGGDISLDSEEGEGTELEFTFRAHTIIAAVADDGSAAFDSLADQAHQLAGVLGLSGLDGDKLLQFYSLCYDIFEQRPFSVIEIRTCSFSVDPLFYVQYKSLRTNIVSHAIVDEPHSQSSLAEYETAFIQHCPAKTFHTLSEAIEWTKTMNGINSRKNP